jgi:aspartate 1-decarboxylase
MLRNMLISKIHRATVTKCDLNYIGSITVDKAILEKAGMFENEKVEVYDINNGHRFNTYMITGKYGSGEIIINGAAARLVHQGDKIIIVSYGLMEEEKARNHQPKIVILNEKNEIVEVR